MRSDRAVQNAFPQNPSQEESPGRGASAAGERLALIDGAIREIQSRLELSPEAKARGIRALERAKERALRSLEGR